MSRWALLALWFLGCAPSGEDPRNRWTAHAPPTGEYRVYFLEPPWEVVEASGTDVFLRIRSNTMVAAGLDGGQGKYELRGSVEPGAPLTQASAAASTFARMGATRTEGPRVFTTEQGIDGVEVVVTQSVPVERWHRVLFLPLDDARVVRIAVDATPSLETLELDAMLGFVEIGPLSP